MHPIAQIVVKKLFQRKVKRPSADFNARAKRGTLGGFLGFCGTIAALVIIIGTGPIGNALLLALLTAGIAGGASLGASTVKPIK